MTKGCYNLDRFVTTLVSTINFETRDFDYFNFNKSQWQKCQACKSFDTKNKFLKISF